MRSPPLVTGQGLQSCIAITRHHQMHGLRQDADVPSLLQHIPDCQCSRCTCVSPSVWNLLSLLQDAGLGGGMRWTMNLTDLRLCRSDLQTCPAATHMFLYTAVPGNAYRTVLHP